MFTIRAITRFCQLAFADEHNMPTKTTKTPRKLPQQGRSRMTVEAILEAAAQVLTKHGYERTNTNAIAEQAGVSVGSLYQYFPNKESLMAALMERHSDEIARLVESRLDEMSGMPLEQTITRLVDAVISAHAINPRLHQVLNEEIPRSERLQHMRAAELRIAKAARSYFLSQREHVLVPDLDLSLFIVMRTIESLCHAVVIERPRAANDDRFRDEVARLVLGYLTTRS
jgi:AcrR family transcriptional regulator